VRIESKDGLHSMDAQSEVETRARMWIWADTDIVVASVKAYLSALNKMLVAMGVYSETETSAYRGLPVKSEFDPQALWLTLYSSFKKGDEP